MILSILELQQKCPNLHPLLVEVDQFLVQWLNQQLEILQTFLNIAVFPERILSSADVAQHILDLFVAKRLPRVVHEDIHCGFFCDMSRTICSHNYFGIFWLCDARECSVISTIVKPLSAQVF